MRAPSLQSAGFVTRSVPTCSSTRQGITFGLPYLASSVRFIYGAIALCETGERRRRRGVCSIVRLTSL